MTILSFLYIASPAAALLPIGVILWNWPRAWAALCGWIERSSAGGEK